MMESLKRALERRSGKAVRERCLRYAIRSGAEGVNAVQVARSMEAYIERGELLIPGYGQ